MRFFKELLCWHDWQSWKEDSSRWASAFSIFATAGSDLAETVLVERYKTRYCKKCGKFQKRSLGSYYERKR